MLYPVLAVVNLVVMIGAFVINGLNGSGPDGTIFKNSTGELSDYFYTVITPSGWTFSIWGVIYTWQALWTLYAVVNICRAGHAGKPAYSDPEFIPPAVLALATLSSTLGVVWLVTFDRLEVEAAFAALVCYSASLYAALVVSYRALDRASPALASQGRGREIWLTRGLLHNGLGVMAAWVSVATLLNLAMVLTYSGSGDHHHGGDGGGGGGILRADDAGTVALAVLSAEVAVFAGADLLLLDRWTRYTLTPYGVLLVALAGSIDKNYSPGARNSVFSVALLSACGLLALVKVVLTLYRHARRPRYRTSMEVEAAKTYNKSSGRLV